MGRQPTTIENHPIFAMNNSIAEPLLEQTPAKISTLDEVAVLADYSFMDSLNSDPDAKANGEDHEPRQVFTGHYVPVNPIPIENPEYITHSKVFFNELGFADNLAESADFVRLFSGDTSKLPKSMRKTGWACGYALSIYGTEYTQQCPFRTGNGYGDGRAISVLEAVIKGQRWEMQLKGGGRTPYCRGADGRAVLRSSVREFLAQEHMHALGVPTSRSLSLYRSKTEQVNRPWYSEGSRSQDPDILVSDPVAISTRVAPSFIRVGQLELFARRARNHDHPRAKQELEMIVSHLIEREYAGVIDPALPMGEKVVLLAEEFRERLTSLVANWIRVGYCQGNFNSDNCAAGGFTLDYGPFGFCDEFNPSFQPWTGGGQHFSFLNQTVAAERNFYSFCTALVPLVASDEDALQGLKEVYSGFSGLMQMAMEEMWADKLGLRDFDALLFSELEALMIQTPVDYTLFFRELSSVPGDITRLKKSFYKHQIETTVATGKTYASAPEEMEKLWSEWLVKWKTSLISTDTADGKAQSPRSHEEISRQMKRVNPKYSLREWFCAPAYQQAAEGSYSVIRKLQEVITQPYDEQSEEVEEQYYRLKPPSLFHVGGLSHYSCSS